MPTQAATWFKKLQRETGDKRHVFYSKESDNGHRHTFETGPTKQQAYDCRREWESIAAEIGITELQSKGQMGHSAGSITASYVVTPDVRDAVQRIADEIYTRTKGVTTGDY